MSAPVFIVWEPCVQETLSMYWKRLFKPACGQQKAAPRYPVGNAWPGTWLLTGVCDSVWCQANRASLTACAVGVDITAMFSTWSWTTDETRPLESTARPVCTTRLSDRSRCSLKRAVRVCLSVSLASTLVAQSISVVGELVASVFPKGVVIVGTPCWTCSKLVNQKRRSLTKGPPAVNPYSCLKNGARPQPCTDVCTPAELKSLAGQPAAPAWL